MELKIKEDLDYPNKSIEKNAFSKHLNKEWLRRSNEITNEKKMYNITRDDLAQRMGIGKETLKKVINQTRPTSSRDYIIAICSQLGMNSEETSEALSYYNMPPLCGTTEDEKNKKYYARDKLLIGLLNQTYIDKKNRKRIVKSIDEINKSLVLNNFKELEIPDKKIKSKISLGYYMLSEKTILNIKDSFFNRYESLETQYNIDMYSCNTLMLVEDKKTKEQLALSYANNGKWTIYKYDKGIDYSSDKTYSIQENYTLYADCFTHLKIKNDLELKKIIQQLDDTKNYRERISAKYKDDKITVFMESYNYYIPELNEYYFIEYNNGTMKYSITKKSQFMYKKMTRNEYINYFKKYDSSEIAHGYSIDELINQYHNNLPNYLVNDYITQNLRKEMSKMEDKVRSFIDKLKNRKIFIRNPNNFDDEINSDYMICQYFEVQDKFNFKKEEDDYGDHYILIESEIKYNDIVINISDLYNAFELGLNTMDDVYNVKNVYGDIEALRENL